MNLVSCKHLFTIILKNSEESYYRNCSLKRWNFIKFIHFYARKMHFCYIPWSSSFMYVNKQCQKAYSFSLVFSAIFLLHNLLGPGNCSWILVSHQTMAVSKNWNKIPILFYRKRVDNDFIWWFSDNPKMMCDHLIIVSQHQHYLWTVWTRSVDLGISDRADVAVRASHRWE